MTRAPQTEGPLPFGGAMYVLRYGRGYVTALRYEDETLSVICDDDEPLFLLTECEALIYSVAIEEITGVPCEPERV